MKSCATSKKLLWPVVSFLIAIVILNALPVIAQQSIPASGPKTTGKERQLVFPSRFSLGRLYVYKDNDPHYYPGSKMVAESLGRFVGEARGTVTVNVPNQAVVYLVASYQLTEHPEMLNKLNPDLVDCFSFGSTGIMADLTTAIKPLSHLTGLRSLELSMCELTDDSLAPIKSLMKLERLNLYVAGINGTCLKGFAGMKKLLSLDLSSNILDVKSYGYLSKLQSLQTLHLNFCGVKDSNMAEIATLPNVKLLELNQALVTGKGLSLLKGMKSLRHLSLTDGKMTTRDLLMLKGTHLQSLKLPLPEYSAKDTDLLQKALPGTKLIRRDQKVGSYEKTLYGPLH